MYEKFLQIKQEKKWLFYLLIIPFIIIAILEFYNKYLVNSGKQAVIKAKEKDNEIEKEQKEAENKAQEHEDNANKIAEQIENTKTDKDWHLK